MCRSFPLWKAWVFHIYVSLLSKLIHVSYVFVAIPQGERTNINPKIALNYCYQFAR